MAIETVLGTAIGTRTAPMPEHVVATAIELERMRLRTAFEGVYRPDGSIDEQALAAFTRALHGQDREQA